ncbi:MAG: fluoride efflux transporter CrcB [Flavobacteriales bacterium]|nr:fluoride efflux transporter CrcB [Flavobacteriales bacterium]
MIKSLLIVALGGGVGSAIRYLVSFLISERVTQGVFPWGTFAVNVIGCFIVGLLYGLLEGESSHSTRLLLITGFCGGFTTFSAFINESLYMADAKSYMMMVLYITLSMAVGLLLCYVGRIITSG